MKTLRIGDFGDEVKILQTKLKRLGYYTYIIDKSFGKKTDEAVKLFQKNNNLSVDGIVGKNTWSRIDRMLPKAKLNPKYFTVWIDAGHGAIHPENGKYTTNGKYYYHGDKNIHTGDGYFYEGVENRIVAELAIELLQKNKIPVVRMYHEYEDTPLNERVEIVRSMQKVGHYGWMHSFHSNAISTSHTQEKLNNTQGGIIFTTKGQNFSDTAGQILYKYWNEYFGDKKRNNGQKWLWGIDSDGDPDREANFYIPRKTESSLIASTLGEFGFFTSYDDTKFITQQQVRFYRAYSILKTAIEMRERFKKMVL